MSDEDLRDLYQEMLFDLAKDKARRGRIDGCAGVLAVNPLCGDEVEFSTRKESGLIACARYECRGCAISQAAAALAAQAIEGLEATVAADLMARAISFISTGAPDFAGSDWEALSGVRKFPLRVKCATMPLRAAAASLAASGDGLIELEDQ